MIVRPMQTVIRTEGVLGLFRGVLSPVMGAMTENAVAFAAQAQMKRLISGSHATADSDMQLWQVFVAGGGTGFCVPFVTVPTELVKTVMQTDRACGSYSQTIRTILDARGPIGLAHGWMTTTMRELLFYSFYFASYEGTKRALAGRDQASSAVGTAGMLLAGGTAGVVAWVASYPVDLVKTRVQAHGLNPKPPSALRLARDIYAEGGSAAFFRGLSPTIIRAFPVNAATFFAFEVAERFLRRFSSEVPL